MTDRLVIKEVWAERFGGLRNATVDLGSGEFVVVAGLNESGKSSLSELMSWLLVGPSGNAESAQRFGKLGEPIGGRLSGTLRGQGFRASGDFKVLQKGAPKDNALTVTFGTQQLDAVGWRGMLSGIDAAMLDAVYLMWGAELHDGANLMAKIEEAALAGMAGSRNVGPLTNELTASVKSLLTSRAAGSSSFKALQSSRGARKKEIEVIRAHARDYADLQRDRDQIKVEVEQVDKRLAELASQVAAHATLLNVDRERQQLADLVVDLEELEPVPESWLSIVAAPRVLAEAVGAVETADHALAGATGEFESARQAAGLDMDVASRIVVGQPEVLAVSRGGQARLSAEEELAKSGRKLRERVGDLDRQQQELDHALAACHGQTIEELSGITLDTGDYGEIIAKIALWQAADSKARAARAEVGKREGDLSGSTETAQGARDAWDRFGIGCTAQEWLGRGGIADPSEPRRRASDIWIFVVAAVVSAGSSFILPRVAWSLVTVVAFVGAFFLQRSGWGGRDDETSGVPSESTSEAADEVVRTERLVADAVLELSAARRDCDTAVELRGTTAQAAVDRAQVSGIVLPPDQEASEAQLHAVNSAVAALRTRDSLSLEVQQARTDCEGQQREADRLGHQVRAVLDRCGVPDGVALADASELIEGFQAVTTKRLEFESASSEHVAARYAYRTLIAPIAAEVEVWSPAAVASRCDELVELRNKRAELSANEREARRHVDKAVSQNDQVRELESQGNSKDSLVRQRDELSSQVGLLKKERSGLQEQVGALGERLEGIAQESELARLSAEAGALDEASDDRVIEAAAHSVARRLLSEVAEQQRQANQPALVKRASELLVAVQSEWEHILVSQDGSTAQVSVRGRNGVEVPAHQLSTGARALLYLALRLAMADQDAADRGFRFPIICDDPLIHLDDERSRQVLPLLAEASNNGHQVVLFTCHRRTVEAAKAVGARIVPLDGGIV